MSLGNGIQGLSGYDIKKLFNMSAAYFWPADQTQIYRTLRSSSRTLSFGYVGV